MFNDKRLYLDMKKKNLPKEAPKNIMMEMAPVYVKQKRKTVVPGLPDFNYGHFNAIVKKSPFSLAEWATLLHISERTLQRYAKDNTTFNGLQIERILLLEHLIDAGNDMFGEEGFKSWLDHKPFSLNGEPVRAFMGTHAGIQMIIDLLGRMAHGIPA